MGVRRRPFVLLGVLTGALAMALFLGAAERGAADTTDPPQCAGKLICVTITDELQASRTPAGGPDHYLNDSVSVFNDGSSANLVNLTVTMTWKDEGNVPTTSDYRPAFSDGRCALTAPLTLTCTTPKSLGAGEALTYAPLVFRTATNDGATGFTLTVTAAAKEQAKPRKGGAPPNDAVATASNTVTYEGDPDHDVSIGGGGIATTLGTSSAVGRQFSRMPIPANAPRDLFKLTELDCPVADVTCIGQEVTTIALGLAPVNLRITYTGPIPAGTNANNIVVLHTRAGDTTPTVIDDACSGTLFSGQPPTSQIPCRRVELTRLPGSSDVRVEIDAWDTENGDWRWG